MSFTSSPWIGSVPLFEAPDVDLLFEEGATEGALQQVVQAFLASDFHLSAKHRFQLLRVIPIGSEKMVFNVDLLHPSEGLSDRPSDADMFVEHITLDIPLSVRRSTRFIAKSIAAPHSGFIFKDGRFTVQRVEVADTNGMVRSANVPVIDELGLLVTKSLSVLQPKRSRDGFDIFLAVAHARNRDELLQATRDLEHRTTEAFMALSHIRSALEGDSFDRRANDYMPEDLRRNPETLVRERPFSEAVKLFLDEAGVPKLEAT